MAFSYARAQLSLRYRDFSRPSRARERSVLLSDVLWFVKRVSGAALRMRITRQAFAVGRADDSSACFDARNRYHTFRETRQIRSLTIPSFRNFRLAATSARCDCTGKKLTGCAPTVKLKYVARPLSLSLSRISFDKNSCRRPVLFPRLPSRCALLCYSREGADLIWIEKSARLCGISISFIKDDEGGSGPPLSAYPKEEERLDYSLIIFRVAEAIFAAVMAAVMKTVLLIARRVVRGQSCTPRNINAFLSPPTCLCSPRSPASLNRRGIQSCVNIHKRAIGRWRVSSLKRPWDY